MEPETGPQDVLRRLYGAFSSAYLTLISIIQGVALGYLATKVDVLLQQPFHLYRWLLVVSTLAAYVAIWNEYLMGALAFVWIPTLFDAVIPFGLFAAEIALAAPLPTGDLRWWMIAFGAAGLAAIVAYCNMFWQARTRSADVLKALGRGHKALPLILTSMYAIASMCGGIFFTSSQLQAWGTTISWIALGALVVFLARSALYWRCITKYAKGTTNDAVAVPSGRPTGAEGGVTR